MLEEPNFAELAVELRVAQLRLSESAAALRLAAIALTLDRDEIEHLAARIGLSADATARLLNDMDQTLGGLVEAHRLIKALIPHEARVQALILGE